MKDNVWFTYKARIQAHKRLEWLDLHSQLLLVWYAILSSALAVISIKHPKALGDDTDVMAAILSVALLGVSLSVSNRDFRGRAIQMRRNYLGLHQLYRSISKDASLTSEQSSRYDELLDETENHREIDDRIARILAPQLTSRHPTVFESIHVLFWLVSRLIITIALYAAPIVFALTL
ncbi:SLATT domain-containing protein [Pseudomonas paralactis]|uniref:SLATT domain-containing protein n=1 Tax=Pseudomonas paralactis TaxID=1615673 RepID=UPI0009E82FA8|nr:SLATT domain-containing protein [Pseudomonas paralactis]